MRTSLNIPKEDLAAFDAVWQSEGYDSRSRAVREAIREYTEAHARLEETTGEVVALLAFDYEHHAVIEPLHTVQHEFQDVISATSHAHQGDWCLEGVFCRGSAPRVRELVYELRDFDAVGRVKVMTLMANDD
ncbi:CopG family ribbon-helix-helix protein [Halocatena marina]|uniref:CopG family ribbon-helix-helix protein n=1 Tax=Halocatena marina TaxID=2934937 RepID=A0ABD5YT54_9EURY|nr:ribbon-helix-helix protein, CopG family [Halocatena marina]